MDLSKLSDDDLQALSEGKLDKVSDEGLSHLTAPAAPADRTPSNTQSLGSQALGLAGKAVEGWNSARSGVVKGMLGDNAVTQFLTGPLKQAQQDVPEAEQVGKLGGAVAQGALLGAGTQAIAPASALGRIGLNAAAGGASGAIQTPGSLSDRAKGAIAPALAGGAVSAVGELLGAMKGVPSKLAGFKTPKQTNAYLEDPEQVSKLADMVTEGNTPELQDTAAKAINESRAGLKSKGLENTSKLRELITGKKLNIDPNDFTDIPGADDILGKYKTQYGNYQPKVDVNAEDVQGLKQAAQSASEYKPGTLLDPVQQAKAADMAKKASNLRSSLESLSPDVKGINQEMQQGAIMSKNLRQGLKNPIAFVSTESPDKMAMLARAERAAPTGITDLGNQLSAAKALSSRGAPSSNLVNALGEGMKDYIALPALRGMNAAQQSSPQAAQSLAALLTQLENEQSKK